MAIKLTSRFCGSLLVFYADEPFWRTSTEIVLAKDNTITVNVRNPDGKSIYFKQIFHFDRASAYNYISGYFNLKARA